ncbi:hypothetical protein CHUAL_002899 [Chamberlinius hualienensis]
MLFSFQEDYRSMLFFTMSLKRKSTDKFKLLCSIVALLTFGIAVIASHCEIVEHSETVKVENKQYSARMNKCVLKPSYTVKSNVVFQPYDEPDFYHEGRVCCCEVDGENHHFYTGKENSVLIRFKKVTKCTCVPCR